MTQSSPDSLGNPASAWLFEGDAEVWRIFTTPRNDQEFCQAWLSLLCRQLPEITAGVVLMQATTEAAFTPFAVWPDVNRDLAFLAPIAERALTAERGVVHRPQGTLQERIHVGYPIKVRAQTLGAVVLEGAARDDAAAHTLLRQIHWGIAWLHDLFQRRELADSSEKTLRIGSVTEVVATALQNHRLQHTLFEVANQIAHHLQCSRVAIGLLKNDTVRMAALSNAAWFEKNTPTMKLYALAMAEAYDWRETIAYQRTSAETPLATHHPASAHGQLAQETGAQHLLSLPLLNAGHCTGVLTLERSTDMPFTSAEKTWLEALTSLLALAIEQKRRAERSYLIHLRDDLRALLGRLFGPRHLIWKFTAATLTLTLAALLFIHTEYRVAAKTVIEGEVQQATVAPFDGFIAQSFVRAGDTVQRGQVLSTLDERELRLERDKWRSEYDQYTRKFRAALAQGDLPDIQVLSAQVKQAQAQLALASERLSRAKITAPFDGIVITGDLSQLLGSPVEQGKKLFEIAPLNAYRVILQVDEREVRHVQAGQRGTLMIAGLTDTPIPFQVSKVTPVATAQEGKNYFRVEARLAQAPPRLRPGMEGIGKISVGEAQLGWILTHSFVDWLRLSLWTWLP